METDIQEKPFMNLSRVKKYLELHGWYVKLVSGENLKTPQAALAVEMKDSARQGLGIETNRADPITPEMEKILWDKGIS